MTQKKTQSDRPVAGPSVLIVDDSFLMRRVLRNILEGDGQFHVCAEAANGIEALEKLREEMPDVILLDVEMPKMDGIEFVKRAKMVTDAAIIVISSITRPGSPEAMEVLSMGVADIIPKPSGVLSLDMETERSDDLIQAVQSAVSA
ncbi:MAG: response regulator [Gammaproteobacteria bacterium]|jgi:two-component system chemotaxis response regulator CheB